MHEGTSSLDELPEEVAILILSELPPESLVSLSKVSQKFNRLASIARLWKKHLQAFQDIQNTNTITSASSEKEQFKTIYLQDFVRIASQQMMEIDHFNSLKKEILSKKLNDEDYDLVVKAYQKLDRYVHKQPARTFQELVSRHKEIDSVIDDLNCILIEPELKRVMNEDSPELILDNLQITRIPESLLKNEAYNSIWSKIVGLSANNNSLVLLPEGLRQCKELRKIHLHQNKIRSLPDGLLTLPKLNTLLISHNLFHSLPDKLGGLKKLTRIFARGNMLEALPPSISSSRDLSVIDISYNRFSTLPLFLGTLGTLRSLDVQGNLLSDIPKELKDSLVNFETSQRQTTSTVLASQKKKPSSPVKMR